jgi:transposase-like protein
MPFRETCRMEERIRMLLDYDTGLWSVSDLCRRYEVSRDTFYAWHGRRASGAPDWFEDRSHATQSCPRRTTPSFFIVDQDSPVRHDDALALQIGVDPFRPELAPPTRMPEAAEGAAEIQNPLGIEADRAARNAARQRDAAIVIFGPDRSGETIGRLVRKRDGFILVVER